MESTYNTFNILFLSAWLLFILIFASCNNEADTLGLPLMEGTYISVAVNISSTGINNDNIFWEDRVDELRMIVFDSNSGSVILNQKLYFPNGFSGSSKSIRLRPGTYDFYFFANESLYAGDFETALLNLKNKSDFQTDSRFLNIMYNPEFIPDENNPGGGFLMSAIYNNITILNGGTEENPLLLPLPTAKVELIRPMAKVEVVFRKKQPGSTLQKEVINTVSINNVASYLSVPPYDNYYDKEIESSNLADLSNLNFANDSIGAVVFYIPELLLPENETNFTSLSINNTEYPILTDNEKIGITQQRRVIPDDISNNSIIRNYHYIINAYVNSDNNEIEIRVYVEPWMKKKYTYIFGGGEYIVLPPVTPTDSSVIMPTLCGDNIEILYKNENLSLQQTYNYTVDYSNQATTKGSPPYYCEKTYGKGWRMINNCELMSYLAALDIANNAWNSYTWEVDNYNRQHPDEPIPLYPLSVRKAAQDFLEKLTGIDLSESTQVDEKMNPWDRDNLANRTLNLIGVYFSPGDILYKPTEFESWWKRTDTGEDWYECEVAFQIPGIWWTGESYISLSNRSNWDRVLYTHFRRMDYLTHSRCVRIVE